MKKPLLLLIDGNALLHRAFHVIPPLTVSKTGEMIGAVYGFASMLLKAIGELKPTHYAIAFDKKGPTFRHHLYDQYKAHRPETPRELVAQLGRVKQLVEAFNLPAFELDGYEADDILGSLSRQAGEQGLDTVIVTGDADVMQLVSPRVKVFYPKPGGSFSDAILYDEKAVSSKYGVDPQSIADLKALVGDKSDNIPGVSGIGNKTAVSLIQKFGGIEQIYTRLDEVIPEKLRNRLRENEEIARQSKELATIVVSGLPVRLELKDSEVSRFSRQQVTELFRELEFTSLLSRFTDIDGAEKKSDTSADGKPKPDVDYSIICTTRALDALIKKLRKAGSFSFDTETTSLNPMLAQPVGISFSTAPGEAYYIPVSHVGLENIKQLPVEMVIKKIKPIFEDGTMSKITQNGKYDVEILAGQGVEVKNLSFDTMIAAHLLGEKSLGLKALAFSRLGVEMTPICDLIGTGAKKKCISKAEIEHTSNYACADADMTLQLAKIFENELHRKELWHLFKEVEMPLVPVLIRMEMNGVAIDSELLGKMSRRLGERLLGLETKIYENAGHKFNINSPQQLGPVLFDELKLPTAGKTKSGYSTSSSVLENLRVVHPIIEPIIEYRQLSKLKSTYIDALPGLINPRTKRLHTCFNQTRTATGRLSSSEPNLQNIPVRGEQGKEIRRAFIAATGCHLMSADYSQIDLRVLAHLSQDPALLETFYLDGDIHSATAVRLLGVSEDDVTEDMRRLAKTVNFGIIYGMSGYGLERATELSREEADQFIDSYFEKYPKVKEYLESTKRMARELGYVQTILGRRRTIPEINSSNRNLREAAERMAINMPVQGTSADIIKVAMVKLDDEMRKRRLESKLLLQVHDELIFEIPHNELEEMKKIVPHIVATSLEISLPLKVDVKTGNNWEQME
ncbi:MAG: DNA polymerase I [Dehalococcoidia bacterium]|nr:MAG: DNA polymerase I [Dehalococcoidia bacterium]